MLIALMAVLAYFLGSLQFGVIFSHFFGFDDPRNTGSGNSGATNVARNFGMKMGLLVLLGDLLKGVVAVLVASLLGLTEFGLALAGLAAVIGHMYPAFHQFKGGKGVATALGVTIMLSGSAAIAAVIVMVLVVLVTKYVSLGSILATVTAVLFMGFHTSGAYMVPVIIMMLLIIFRHAANIKRLMNGRESKFSFGSKK